MPTLSTIRFTVDWKIVWSEYLALTVMCPLRKSFITSFNNVPLRWSITLHRISDDGQQRTKKNWFVSFESGPLIEQDDRGVSFEVHVIKSDRSIKHLGRAEVQEKNGHFGWGYLSFDDKDLLASRAKTRNHSSSMIDSDSLIFEITLKIPPAAFSYVIARPIPRTPSPQWMRDLFANIEDSEKSSFWNVKLISRESDVFYCHKNVTTQSSALEAVFRRLPSVPEEPEPDPDVDEHHPPPLVLDEYKFPKLSTVSLRVVLQYLYTGQCAIDEISVTNLIEVAVASEEYDLRTLKQSCVAVLWTRATMAPASAFEIVQFADQQQTDLIELKERAMDVLVENYESVVACADNLKGLFGGASQGVRLQDEFFRFMARRVRPIFKC